LNAGDVTLGDGGDGTLTSGNATKSGYGITANVSVASSYVSNTTVTASYNFTSAQTVSLEKVGGTWQFPVNSSSVTGARKIYIPVETKDGTYTITFTVKALDPQATALTGSNVYLTDTKTVTLTIDGSMYEDDFTADS
jgi:archaellum component FlaG (FlaF/FlaG flagellin family)